MIDVEGYLLPPEHTGTVIHSVASAGALVYSKYIVNKMGFIDPRREELREYALPIAVPNPYNGFPASIQRLLPLDGTVLAAAMGSGGLFHFNPATRRLAFWQPERSRPVLMGHALALDPAGAVWCTGFLMGNPTWTGQTLVLCRIARSAGRLRATMWPLPSDFYTIGDLWFDAAGRPWFSCYNSGGFLSPRPSFGCLDPGRGDVTGWYVDPSNLLPFLPSVSGWGPRKTVWFSQANGNGFDRLLRLDLARGSVEAVAHPAVGELRALHQLDEKRLALVSWDGHLNRVDALAAGVRITAPTRTWPTAAQVVELRVHRLSATAAPPVPVKVVRERVTELSAGPFHRWRLPSPTGGIVRALSLEPSPDGLLMADMATNRVIQAKGL